MGAKDTVRTYDELKAWCYDKWGVSSPTELDIRHAQAEISILLERERNMSYWHTQLTYYLLKPSNLDDLREDIWSLVQSTEGEWEALRKTLGMSTDRVRQEIPE